MIYVNNVTSAMTPEEKRETFKYLVDLSAYHHSVMRQTDFFCCSIISSGVDDRV